MIATCLDLMQIGGSVSLPASVLLIVHAALLTRILTLLLRQMCPTRHKSHNVSAAEDLDPIIATGFAGPAFHHSCIRCTVLAASQVPRVEYERTKKWSDTFEHRINFVNEFQM